MQVKINLLKPEKSQTHREWSSTNVKTEGGKKAKQSKAKK